MATKKIVLLSGVGAEIAPLKTTHIGRIFKFDDFQPVKAFKEALLDGLLVSLGDKTNITEEDIDGLTDVDLKYIMFQIRLLTYPPKHLFNVVLTWQDEEGEDFQHKHPLVITDSLLRVEFANGANKEKPIYRNYGELKKSNDYVLPDSGLKVRLHLLTTKQAVIGNTDISLVGMIKQRNPMLVREDGEVESLAYNFEEVVSSVIDVEFLFDKIIENEGFVKTGVSIKHPKHGKQSQSAELLYLPNFFFPSLSKLL